MTTTTTDTRFASLAPLLSERCMLLDDQHRHALIGKLIEVSKQARVPMDETPQEPEYFRRIDGIAYIPIVGVLTKNPTWFDDYCGLCPAAVVMEGVAEAVDDPSINSIVLDIDSPGGFVNGSVELADAVAAANKIKPVTAVVRGLCCSAAYWIASQAGQIISRRECEVGNIGVYSVLADVSKFYSGLGVDLTLIASGQFKGMGADGKVTDDLKSDTRRIITGLFQQFITAVAAGRGLDIERVTELADGRSYLGPQAQQLGLIDELASSFDAAIEAIAGAAAPESEAKMFKIGKKGKPALPAPAAAAAKAADDSGDAKKVLQGTIDTANAHKDQSRKALDAYNAMTEDPDDETKDLAKQTVAACDSANEESQRCADAMRPDDSIDEDPDKDDEMAGKFTHVDYIQAFGDAGARWFIEKKPFAQAAAVFIGTLKAEHKTETDALKAENEDLKKRLGAVDRGNEPAAFSAEAVNTPGQAKAADIAKLKNQVGSDGMARFAAGMKFVHPKAAAAK